MKKIVATMLVASLCVGMLAGCGSKEEAPAQEAAKTEASEKEESSEKDTFTIAYAPNESTTESADARYGLADDLAEVIGMEVEEIQASDYNAIIEALRTGQADMAYLGAMSIALAIDRAEVEPIVMKAPEGDKEQAVYRSVLITQADNDEINSIQDIKGKTMAFVDPDSTSGSLVPSSDIMTAFPDEDLNVDILRTNGEFFEAVSFSGKHQAGLQAVIMGDVDVAPISDQILASEIANGNADADAIKVFHESGAIPAEAMVVGTTVDDEMKAKLTEFLVNYANEDYFNLVIKKEGARFVECDIEDYAPIVELNHNINGAE